MLSFRSLATIEKQGIKKQTNSFVSFGVFLTFFSREKTRSMWRGWGEMKARSFKLFMLTIKKPNTLTAHSSKTIVPYVKRERSVSIGVCRTTAAVTEMAKNTPTFHRTIFFASVIFRMTFQISKNNCTIEKRAKYERMEQKKRTTSRTKREKKCDEK